MTGTSWTWISGNLIITTSSKRNSAICYAIRVYAIQIVQQTSGQASVHHARMRMGFSGLNVHRRKYNFINDNTCPLCNMKAENTYHYFLVDPVLATRGTCHTSIFSQILSNTANQYVIVLSTRQYPSELHDLLLNGSNLLQLVNSQRFDP